jgi:hypothetical protein
VGGRGGVSLCRAGREEMILCPDKLKQILVDWRKFLMLKKILGQFSKNHRTFYPKNCR